MLKPVLTINQETREKELYVVPETELEEKFIVWFSHENHLPRKHFQGKLSLQLPAWNEPEVAQQSLTVAFDQFIRRFRYAEIPNVTGLHLDKGKEILAEHGLHWSIEQEVAFSAEPPGTILFQNPRPQAVAVPDSVVYLHVSSRK